MSKFDVSIFLSIVLFMFVVWFFYRNFRKNLWNKKTTLVSLWLILLLIFSAFVSVKSVKNSKFINDINPMAPTESSACSTSIDIFKNAKIYLPDVRAIQNMTCYTFIGSWRDNSIKSEIAGDISTDEFESLVKRNNFVKEHADYKQYFSRDDNKWDIPFEESKNVSKMITDFPLRVIKLYYGEKDNTIFYIFSTKLPDNKIRMLLTVSVV